MSGPSCASAHHLKNLVTDLDTSVRWYQTVLKAKRERIYSTADYVDRQPQQPTIASRYDENRFLRAR
jgi:hypothetical protein